MSSWANELYNLYDKIFSNPKLIEENPLLPLYHSSVNAQLEVTLTEDGDFVTASKVEEKENALTIIPVTEDSGTRTSGIVPHPFADTLKYLAGDYGRYCGKDNKDFHDVYMEQLQDWLNSENTHTAVKALYTYLNKNSIISDLVSRGILTVDEAGVLTDDKISQIQQADCFVRFIVNYTDISKERRTWLDNTLYERYIAYEKQRSKSKQLCYATGEKTSCTYKHPNKILNAGSKAKLFSSNDESGFTYRGRFANKEQAVSIGYEFSQKIHNALKWLIKRQGIIIEGTLALVAWESCLSEIPKIDEDSLNIFGAGMEGVFSADDFPKTFVSYKDKLEKMISGYQLTQNEDSKIMVLMLDAATTGRMSVNMYSELMASEFYENIVGWHRDTAWNRYNSTEKQNYIGSFSIKQIADHTYGTETSNFVTCKPEIKKEVYSRLLPCIIESRKLPEDIVRSLTEKASRPLAYDKSYHWHAVLETACGMIRKNKIDKGENCKMALDKECKTRSYLYGRLIAVADVMEESTYDRGEGRTTNALRYFEAFSNKPCQTWSIIYNRLIPYLNKMDEGKRRYYTKLIDEITRLFERDEFNDNSKLDPEFLHAYSCQRCELYTKKTDKNEEE